MRPPATKFPSAVLLCALIQSSAAAATGYGAGSASLRLEPGQAATRAAAFTGNFHQPGGTGGQVVAGVNTFTGQPSYTVPLYTLGARGEVSFPFNLTFSGPTFPTVENNNDRAPAGWLGVGWSMGVPFVAVNHKGTRTYSDDVVFCNLGPYGGGQVLWQPETKRYHVATAPGILVTRDTVSNSGSPLYRQIKAWTFTIPGSGVRLVFGDAAADTAVNSQRHVRHARGMILASPYNADSARPFLYRWDLRRMEDDSRKTGIDFEYQKFQETLSGGKSYTRESYLHKALWRDEYGNEIQRVELTLDTLQTGEYFGYFPGEAKTSQKLYETRYLRSLTVFHEGAQHVKYSLKRNVKPLTYGKKGVLDSIIPLYGPGERRAPGWAFLYRDGDQMLREIVPPSGAKERYEYQTLNLSATAGGRDGRHAFRDTTGAVLLASNKGTGWWPEASCDDRFCYEIVVKASGDNKKYVRVAYNTGNYFDTTAIVFQKIINPVSTAAHEIQVVPMGDYLLIANVEWGTVDLWEWDGALFRRRNDSLPAGDPLRSHFGYASGKHTNISVHGGGPNYFLVYRHEPRGSLPRRVWVYMRDPVGGKWKNLTQGLRGSSACLFNNHPKPRSNGNMYDPAEGDSCFTWKEPLLIAASDRMFAARMMRTPGAETSESFLYWWAQNARGTAFDSIGQLIPFLPDSIQGTGGGSPSRQNWKYRINDLRMGPDYLAVKAATSTGNNSSRFDFLFHDGTVVKRIAALGWETDNSARGDNRAIGINHDRYVLHGGNYFLHVNTRADGPRRVEYWRRRQNADSVFFVKTGPDLRTDIPREDNADNRIALGPRHFSIEYYPADAFDDWVHPRKPPLTDGAGNIRSWLYRINDTAGVDSVPAASYTFNWGGGCSRKAWNMSFSGLDNVLMGTTHRGGSVCGCTDNCKIRNVSARLNTQTTSLTLDTITDPIHSTPGSAYLRDRSWSFGARLALAMFITHDSIADTVWNRRYFFDGRTYSSAVTTDVVRRFVRHATPDSAHPPQVTGFEFLSSDPAFVTGFNHNSLTAQFEYAKVTHKGLPGAAVYTQHVDHRGYKLLLDSAGLSGRVRSVTTLNGAGDTLAVRHTAFGPPYARGWSAPGVRNAVSHPWPPGVAMNRPEKTVTRQWSDDRSYQTHRTFYHVYADSLEKPLFTVTEQGDRRAVTQSILESDAARVVRTLAYDYPDTATLTSAFLNGYRQTPLPLDAAKRKYAVSSARVGYDPAFKYKAAQTYGWRDPGGSWSDEELKAGPIPAFDPDYGAFVAAEVSRRDGFGQPAETFTEDGENGRKYVSVFHEGRAALPVGVVTGARRDNAAVLTAENGSVPQLMTLGKLDRDTAWTGPGVTYDSTQVRTGRYSFKVTDGFGPSRNLYLKDVTSEGFGFIASAWIYGVSDTVPPVFSVSRRHANWSQNGDTVASPAEGAYVPGRWQRWEVVLPHAWLTAGGMFADESGDFLRFFIGTSGDGQHGSPDRVIYVDDIVLRPDNAVFSLTAYNERGQATHGTDTHHRTFTREYGFAGQPTVTRDERGRIFGQTGFNKPGENLP